MVPPFLPLLSTFSFPHLIPVSLDFNKLRCFAIFFPFFPQRSEAVLTQSPMCSSAFLSHQIWSPPSYATARILPRAPVSNHGNSASVCKNKPKVQQPLYYHCYYATFSNIFTKAAFSLFFFFPFHLPTNHYLILYCYFISFPHFPLLCLSLELQKDS